MNIVFTPSAWDDLRWWYQNESNSLPKIMDLIEECRRDPFNGTGKPEALKHMKPYWSRRIDKANRMLYVVSGKVTSMENTKQLLIGRLRGHY